MATREIPGASGAGAPQDARETASLAWGLWRGSPELLAHVARVADRLAGAPADGAERRIDVNVAGDHELYASPLDFTANVTREALRDFTEILIVSSGPELGVTVRLSWHDRGPTPWDRRRAEVTATVACDDADRRAAVLTALYLALRRGGTDRGWEQGLVHVAAMVLVGFASLVAGLFVSGFLANVLPWFQAEWLGGLIVPVGLLLGYWAYPSLEVAAPGESRLARLTRAGGGVLLSAALAFLGSAHL